MQSAITHPPHILNEDGNKSLSSFIPFCSFGNDMEAMGTKVKGFNIPVCNSFKAKVIHDQLCYEVDLEKYEEKENRENELEQGLILLLDLNEDRQSFGGEMNMKYYTNFFLEEKENTVQIHLDTICNIVTKCRMFPFSYNYLDPVTLHGEGEFDLNIVREMDVTDSFMGLPLEVKDCQNEEDLVDCTTRHHRENVLDNCGCLPLSIGSAIKNVKTNEINYFINDNREAFKNNFSIC